MIIQYTIVLGVVTTAASSLPPDLREVLRSLNLPKGTVMITIPYGDRLIHVETQEPDIKPDVINNQYSLANVSRNMNSLVTVSRNINCVVNMSRNNSMVTVSRNINSLVNVSSNMNSMVIVSRNMNSMVTVSRNNLPLSLLRGGGGGSLFMNMYFQGLHFFFLKDL